MKLKSLALLLLATCGGSGLTQAATDSAEDSYNLARAKEEYINDNNATAYDYLQKELKVNPKNGYAHDLMAHIQYEAENYSEAMSAINMAIKYLPKTDKEQRGACHASRAVLYAVASDTIAALKDFDQALKLSPEDTDIMEMYGQLLYKLKRYDDADALYNRIVSLDPTNIKGYLGLGRNERNRGNYDAAIQHYNKVIALYDNYAAGYSFRAECYLKQEKYLEAIDDVVKALSIDGDDVAWHELSRFPVDQLTLVVTKLKAMAAKEPREGFWPYAIGCRYEQHNMYREAIAAYQKSNDTDASAMTLARVANCCSELGEYAKALEAISQAQQMNPDNLDLISEKADILGNSGDIDGAIAEWTNYIEKNPDDGGGYYRRGFFEDNDNRIDAALEDYDMSIMLAPDYAYAYLGRGDMLMRKGKTDEAKVAYRKVIELDTVPNTGACAMYAFLNLGQKDNAINFMNRVIESDPEDKGIYYDAACFYSRMGDLEKALAYLRTSFEKGFRRFHHVMADDDLEPLRATEDFKALIEEYKQKSATPTASSHSEKAAVAERVEIPFTPEGGCFSVKCTINELPLNFLFDTGASSVSLSQVEANFMLKNGYLNRNDIVGTGRFVDANGDISEGTVINLRNVNFGGMQLSNVRASVVRNQRAPLLLGQSVLGRLGSIEIDNEGRKLIIKSK